MCPRDLPDDDDPYKAEYVLRVLLFAPATDLLLASAEVAQIANTPGLFVQQHQGTITRADAAREVLRERDRWDVLWFATHGGHDGILFSDGLLTASAIIPLVKASGAYLIVLNTCDSEDVARQISDLVNVDVIATVTQVPDYDAFTTGAYLAHHLAETGDPRRAYNLSRPGGDGSVYRYFTGRSMGRLRGEEQAPKMPPAHVGGEDKYDALRTRIWMLEGDMRVLEVKLDNVRTSIMVGAVSLAILAAFLTMAIILGGV